MSKQVIRRNLPRRTRYVSSAFLEEKLADLEARMEQLETTLADQAFRLARRIGTLERGSAYVQVRGSS